MQLPGVNYCAVPVLRSVNVLFALGNAVLIAKLRRLLSPSNSHLLVHALMIISFPVHFFFAFLFYTDGGATFFVLFMYVLAEQVDVQLPAARRGSCILSAVVSSRIRIPRCMRVRADKLIVFCVWFHDPA